MTDYELAKFSAAAYFVPEALGEWAAAIGYEAAGVSVQHTGAALFWNADDLVVSFTGSNDGFDWFENLDFRKTAGPLGSVHAGFNRAFTRIRGDLFRVIGRHRRAGQNLWVTGHSLGGALATLCGAWIAESGASYQLARVTTFGSPRLMGWNAAKKYDAVLRSRTMRYVNEGDPVPHVPGPWRFKHVGQLAWLRDGQVERRIPLLDLLFGWWRGRKTDQPGLDYLIEAYLRRLAATA